MNDNLTEIAFILDRSGSMASMREAAIDGYNHFVAEQRKIPGESRLTLTLFDYVILIPHFSQDVNELPSLTTQTYVPRGSTALLDAIGETIDKLGSRLGEMSEEARPGHVIVVILTDGEENASFRYTWEDISGRISHQRDRYSWEFLFLGADESAIATAGSLNIRPEYTASYTPDGTGHTAALRALTAKAGAMMKVKKNLATKEEYLVAEKPLAFAVREEDAKRRK